DVRDAKGTPLWLPLQQQGYVGQAVKPIVAYGKLLGKNNIGSHDFILLVQLDASFIEQMITEVRLSPNGATAVVDASGKKMSSNTTEAFSDNNTMDREDIIEGDTL